MSPVQELTVSRPALPSVALPRVALRHRGALAVLALAALTFLVPSSPTYDPWAWVIWGREILHLDLPTIDGPSWKPLPVLLTTPFSLFGGLAPDLWMYVARAGAIASVVMVFRLGRRLGGVPGGIAAAVPYALAPWTLRNGAMGNSEGMLVALALAAIERHLDGRPRSAFAFAVGAALLRPETWPFVGLYGLWLLWREPAVRGFVVAGFASLPLLWLLPEYLGSGDLLRAAHRAQTPRADSVAFANDPVRALLDQFAAMFTPMVWAGLGALVLVVLWRRFGGRREIAVLGALLLGALLWVVEVAVMTSDGFSGNTRYLVMPATVLCLAAGVGVGWLARAALGPRAMTGHAGVALAAVLAVAFALPAVRTVPADVQAITYEGRLNDEVAGVVARAGGAARLRACGDVYTGPFQVPVVAWNLHMHTTQVSSLVAIRPAVVFRVRSTLGSRPGPSLRPLGDPSDLRTFAIGRNWRVVGVCRRAE